MKHLAVIAGLISVALAAHPALAADGAGVFTVEQLNQSCTSMDARVHMACTYYIRGAFDGTAFLEKGTLCIPRDLPELSLELAIKDTLKKDLAAFPKDKDLPAISMVYGVLKAHYACTRVGIGG